jgi:hypothetical protein
MSEQGGDRIQAHATVHGLGCQGVTQLMGGDVADSGCFGNAMQGGGDAVGADRAIAFE